MYLSRRVLWKRLRARIGGRTLCATLSQPDARTNYQSACGFANAESDGPCNTVPNAQPDNAASDAQPDRPGSTVPDAKSDNRRNTVPDTQSDDLNAEPHANTAPDTQSDDLDAEPHANSFYRNVPR